MLENKDLHVFMDLSLKHGGILIYKNSNNSIIDYFHYNLKLEKIDDEDIFQTISYSPNIKNNRSKLVIKINKRIYDKNSNSSAYFINLRQLLFMIQEHLKDLITKYKSSNVTFWIEDYSYSSIIIPL